MEHDLLLLDARHVHELVDDPGQPVRRAVHRSEDLGDGFLGQFSPVPRVGAVVSFVESNRGDAADPAGFDRSLREPPRREDHPLLWQTPAPRVAVILQHGGFDVKPRTRDRFGLYNWEGSQWPRSWSCLLYTSP